MRPRCPPASPSVAWPSPSASHGSSPGRPAPRPRASWATSWSYLTDFYERAERSEKLGRGQILRREDLEPLEGLAVADVLRRHPGTGPFTTPRMGRPCEPVTYWNGLEVPVGDIPVASVEGMEIYRRREVPAAYMADPRARACGVVLVWNRPVRPGEGRRFTAARLAAALGAAVLFVLVAR